MLIEKSNTSKDVNINKFILSIPYKYIISLLKFLALHNRILELPNNILNRTKKTLTWKSLLRLCLINITRVSLTWMQNILKKTVNMNKVINNQNIFNQSVKAFRSKKFKDIWTRKRSYLINQDTRKIFKPKPTINNHFMIIQLFLKFQQYNMEIQLLF